MIPRSIWPNLVTVLNMLMGYWAIVATVQGRYLLACWLIVIASILDGLDGAVARWTHQSSRLGAEIDSFADTISFGIAPALLVYVAVLHDFGKLGFLITFVYFLCGVLRLARFNLISLETLGLKKKKRGFIGLPIPASALILVGYYIYTHKMNDGSVEGTLFLSMIPIVSLLMISPIPYRRIPVIQLHGSKHPHLAMAFIVMVTGFVLWNPAIAIFPLMLVYLFTGPVGWVVRHLYRIGTNPDDDLAEDSYSSQDDEECQDERDE